jgi:hypothetical protein
MEKKNWEIETTLRNAFISQRASEVSLEAVGCLSVLSEDMYTVNSHEKICETEFFHYYGTCKGRIQIK